MKTIDIRTTQNVTITYELAEVRDRMIAFFLDTMFKGLGLLLIYWIFMILFSDSIYEYESYFAYFFIIPVSTFYSLVFEFFMNGQTPGKRILKIKVIKLNGKQPTFYDYLLRWTFRIIDIALSLGIVGVLLIVSSDFAQRLGDMASNTAVVRVNNKVNISLMDILKIDSRQSYVPTYTAIANLPEDDILIIKQTLERYAKYKNDAHKKAILKLCNRLSEILEVEDVGPDKIKFLKTLIRDYIVLTR